MRNHRADAASGHALAEKERRQQDRPGRHGELEREYGRERQQHQAKRPQILRAEMHAVAQDVQRQPPHRDAVPLGRPKEHDHADDHEAKHRPQRQDLHHGERSRQLSDRDRHHAERQQRADHPQHDASKLPDGSQGGGPEEVG